LPHEAADRASRDVLSLPPELAPHLAHAVDAEVRIEYAPDVGLQDEVAPGPGRQPGRVGAPGDMGAVRRRGDRQHLADRLDPVGPAMVVDEGDHRFSGRSSSAWAKYADALRRISLAWRSSRFSRSRALIRALSSVAEPP
jgi:hypothetical protein